MGICGNIRKDWFWLNKIRVRVRKTKEWRLHGLREPGWGGTSSGGRSVKGRLRKWSLRGTLSRASMWRSRFLIKRRCWSIRWLPRWELWRWLLFDFFFEGLDWNLIGLFCFELQIKREISTMKLIRHPNVIRMYEVSWFACNWALV